MSLRVTGISFYGVDGSFGNLYPVYVRGTAYLALGQGAEAAVEFWNGAAPNGPGICPGGRSGQSQVGLPGFSDALERRRRRHSDPQASPGGVREAAVIGLDNLFKRRNLVEHFRSFYRAVSRPHRQQDLIPRVERGVQLLREVRDKQD